MVQIINIDLLAFRILAKKGRGGSEKVDNSSKKWEDESAVLLIRCRIPTRRKPSL